MTDYIQKKKKTNYIIFLISKYFVYINIKRSGTRGTNVYNRHSLTILFYSFVFVYIDIFFPSLHAHSMIILYINC